jgi:hypothetical protein
VREPPTWHRMPRRRRGATLCVERASSWFSLLEYLISCG